jgi:hypothetical protein
VPLFDPENPVSCELKAAFRLADVIASQAMYQEIAGVTTTEAARLRIVIGPMPGPNDAISFTLDERENSFIYTQIYRVNGSFITRSAGSPGAKPYESGQLQVDISRLIRESEAPGDVDVFFWDRISQLAVDIQEQIDSERGDVASITTPDGPWRSKLKVKDSQGEFMTASLVADWGDVDQTGGDL